MDFAAVLFAKISGQSFYNIGPNKPDPQFNSFPWFNTTVGRWYTFQGQWIAPHPLQYAQSIGLRWDWAGSESSVWSLDGGDGTDPTVNPPGSSSGAMWVVDHDFDGRFGVGPGIVPNSNPVATIAVGGISDDQGNSGEYAHILTQLEGAIGITHQHVTGVVADYSNDDIRMLNYPGSHPFTPTSPNVFTCHGNIDAPGQGPGVTDGDLVTSPPIGVDPTIPIAAHNTMPPYRGIFKIMRSGRSNYVIP